MLGRVGEPEALDLHGWRAPLVVERALAGGLAPGASLEMAWEELGGRAPRFAQGERVLVALDPLPEGSLWRQRFPQRDAWAVAARGEAFARAPSAASVQALAAWLALPPETRAGPAAADALVGIAALAEPPLADAALGRLRALPGLEVGLGAEGARRWARLLADADRPLELRRRAARIAGERGLLALESTLDRLASEPSPLQGAAVEGLARLRGGLPPERIGVLLASGDPAVRAAALRFGGTGVPEAQLPALARTDPDARVRAAALAAFARRRGDAALEPALAGLDDPDGRVRRTAAETLARIGPPALPPLRQRVWSEGADADRVAPAFAALFLLGPPGIAEIDRAAREHPDERIRGLARLVLGREMHVHEDPAERRTGRSRPAPGPAGDDAAEGPGAPDPPPSP